MSQYKTGTASVANGSADVTLDTGALPAQVIVGSAFKFQGENATYNINSIDSGRTAFTISPVYAGTTRVASSCYIHWGFTAGGLYELSSGDVDFAFLLTLNMRKINDVLALGAGQIRASTGETIQISVVDGTVSFGIVT
jgi:hypothetical protein